jgi:hypothetical protein
MVRSLKVSWPFPVLWTLIRSSTDRSRSWSCFTLLAALPLRECHWAGVPTSEAAFSPRRGVRCNWDRLLTVVCQFPFDFPACDGHSSSLTSQLSLAIPYSPTTPLVKNPSLSRFQGWWEWRGRK